MAAEKHWYLFSYDIRDQKRWAKVYKKLCGTGDHLQLSVFRVHLSRAQLERLRWEVEGILTEEDDLLIVRLCEGCAKRVVDTRAPDQWKKPKDPFEII
jgi:CRISPR-associated protein Cas2